MLNVGHVLDYPNHLLFGLAGNQAGTLSHLSGSRLRGGYYQNLGVR